MVTSEKKSDLVNDSGHDEGWRNGKGKAVANDVQRVKPWKEYR